MSALDPYDAETLAAVLAAYPGPLTLDYEGVGALDWRTCEVLRSQAGRLTVIHLPDDPARQLVLSALGRSRKTEPEAAVLARPPKRRTPGRVARISKNAQEDEMWLAIAEKARASEVSR